MSDIDLQFEEFLKEPLSTDESPDTNSSPKQTNVKTKLPEPRMFWWMKPKVSAEPVSHRSSLSSTSIDEKLDSPQLDRTYGLTSTSPKSANVKPRASASPEISSSMAEFLEKEKFCKEMSSSISEVDSPGMDLDDVTDDEIGSIMEQLSQLAGSGDDSVADKSVEEILKEAEDLVRETSHSFSALTEGRDILTVPLTPERVVRSQAINILSKPSIKSKSQRSGESSRDKRSSRSSSAPPTSRKTGDKIAKGKGGRISGTKSSYTIRQTDLLTEDNTVDDSLRQSLRSAAERINSNMHVTSHCSSKVKDVSRKEKSVTFNEDFVSPEIENTNVPNTQVSSQDVHRTLSSELESYSDRDSEISRAGSSSSHNEVSSRKRQMTEIVSISPPLIQHGDIVGTPEAIFQLIDDEVRNEIVAALKESSRSANVNNRESNRISKEPENNGVNIEEEIEVLGLDNSDNVPVIEISNSTGTSLTRQPLSVVLEESSLSETSSETKKSSESNVITEKSHRKDISIQVTDTMVMEQIESLKEELLQEKRKIMNYKDQLSTEEQERKKQLDSLKFKHEEEMFEVKKEVYMLNAKIADLEKQQENISAEKVCGEEDAPKEHRITLLEAELQQQEQLMLGYQRENVKLCQDMKHLREEMKTKEQSFAEEKQQLTLARQDHEVKRLMERLKDKDEVIVKLQIEIQAFKDKHMKLERVTDELDSSNKALKVEIEKYKRAASKTSVTPVKTTQRNQEIDRYREELSKREREVDEIRKELHLTQSNLVTTKAAISEHQLQVGELENKVYELQALLTKERSQNRTHIHKNEEDKKKIQDLTRQVKEMERILRRHHPNSISALILTANSESTDSGSGQTPRVKFLENRVQQLEQELGKSETESQTKIQEIQNKLQEMKVKYEEHTSNLELQLATAKHQSHMWRQTAEKIEAKVSPEQQPVRETKQMKKALPPPMVIAVGAPPANALAVREDSHLVATIRGLTQELSTKERELSKIRRELDEMAKTNRRLQKERERHLGIVAVPSRPPAVRGPPRDEQSSESSQRSSTKVYEVVSPPENQENVSKLEQENGKLRQELLRLEEEYRSLQTKRLEDLNILQEEHEVEIDHLISDHMTRNSNPHVSDLQNQLCSQQSLIDHLKDQLRRSEEFREELELLRVEQVHLEKSNMELHKKLTDLRNIMTPEMIQYEALQEKLSELERRHEVREQKLQAMVKDLLRRNAEQRALSGDDSNATTMREKLLDKNRQLCQYRAEIDRILDTLREFNKHKKTGNAVI